MPNAVFLDELCWRIVGAGVKLWRTTRSRRHASSAAARFRRALATRQEHGRAVQVHRGVRETTDFQQSPIRRVIAEGATERIRRATRDGTSCAACAISRAEGATDYLATRSLQPQPVSGRRPGRAMRGRLFRHPGRDDRRSAAGAGRDGRAARHGEDVELLLDTYLGHSVGPRVLAARSNAASANGCVPSSSPRSARLHADVGPAAGRGGDRAARRLIRAHHRAGPRARRRRLEIRRRRRARDLPVRRDKQADAASAAMAAATEALRRLDAWNSACRAEKLPPLNAGIGLHLGDVIYGNVGAPDRLDFTAIAPPSTSRAGSKG